MNAKKVVLVTGGSSGIGREISALFAAHGFRVFAASRHPANTSDHPAEVEPVQLDVTDETSVARAVRDLLERAGRIDVLVNNAGYWLLGGVEETTLDEARLQFETNFFGALRMMVTVLPAMREQRSGRIVNVSSIFGFMPGPFMGIYAATKHALEAASESLDHEVRHLGIRSVLIEPYATRTNLADNGRTVSREIADYVAPRQRVLDEMARRIKNGDSPRDVARVVFNAATTTSPKPRYPVGTGATLSALRRFVPARLFAATFRKQFHLA